MIKGFVVKPEFKADFDGDLDIVKGMRERFCSLDEASVGWGCGNLHHRILMDRRTNKFVLLPADALLNLDTFFDTYALMGEVIPSSLLMYRLACTFKGKIAALGESGYKYAWQYALKHIPTGEGVTFGEWKGGAMFWTKFTDVEDAPKEFLDDLLQTLNGLIDSKFPHPYNRLIAGHVA